MKTLMNENFDQNLRILIHLLDYMDEILDLIAAIFKCFDQARLNSMTLNGQCRLYPLIICVQEASCLYEYIVQILFHLYEGYYSFKTDYVRKL